MFKKIYVSNIIQYTLYAVMILLTFLFFFQKLKFDIWRTVLFGILLTILFITDKKTFTLPIKYNFGLLISVFLLLINSKQALIGILFGFIVSFITYLLKRNSMGLGDVILISSLGGILTINYLFEDIIFAAIIGFIFTIYKTKGDFSVREKLPFGSFLIAGVPLVGIFCII